MSFKPLLNVCPDQEKCPKYVPYLTPDIKLLHVPIPCKYYILSRCQYENRESLRDIIPETPNLAKPKSLDKILK